MTDALKSCIHRRPSLRVNLKVAALWMSTPSHVDLFKCHRSLFCSCETGQTKARESGGAVEGGDGGGGKDAGKVFFFSCNSSTAEREKPNGTQSARPQQVFHLTLQNKKAWVCDGVEGRSAYSQIFWVTKTHKRGIKRQPWTTGHRVLCWVRD